MPPKKSKNNKKGKTASGFDYEALIPLCLSGDDRELVKKFLLNELETAEERDDALAVFAAAVIQDRENSSDSDDDKLVHELKNVVGGSSSVSAAEVKRETAVGGAGGPAKGKTAGDASSSSSNHSAAPASSRPTSVVTLADHIAHLKIGEKGGKKKGKAQEPVARARGASASSSDWERDANAVHVYATPQLQPAASSSSAAAAATAAAAAAGALDCQQKRVNPEVANEIRKNVNVGWWASKEEEVPETTDENIAAYAQGLGGELYNFISYPIGGMKRSNFKLERSSTTIPRDPAAAVPVPRRRWGKADESDESSGSDEEDYGERTDSAIPPIYLPDVQLANPHWETYIAGHPSDWIDCDDDEEDPWAAMLSCVELEKELNYAHYLGLNTVVVEVWHRDAPALAGVISKFLWTVQSNLKICIVFPTDKSLLDGDEDVEEHRDIWEIWADFRTLCGNFAGDRLCCGIKLMMDLDDEFTDLQLLQRWHAEPLIMFTMDTNVFTTNDRTGGADLAPAHTKLLETLWTSETMTATIRACSEAPPRARLQYAQAIRSIIGPLWLTRKLAKKPNFLDLSEVNYQDVIQKPLQPLSDNLQSSVYNTFEADSPKYKHYGQAVEAAIHDMITKRGKGDIVLYVLGAGRGPLMSAAIAAEKRVNEVLASGGPRVKLELVVVEKNENAVVTLKFLNSSTWHGRVRIVQADMRDLQEHATSLGLRRPDIIVSELLGSFGDNELSPECLDGCVDWLKEDTISIPQSYTSYCEPVASLSLYHSIKAQPTSYYFKGRQANGRRMTEEQPDGTYTQAYPQGREIAAQDMLYVVYLDKVVRQFKPKPYFTFNHPCFDGSQTAGRPRWMAQQHWVAPTSQEIMGFACYFDTLLYKDVKLSKEVKLSIVRGEETPDMLSWFPAVLPLREPLRVHKGDTVTFVVERCSDLGGVWYEWHAKVKDVMGGETETDVQNVNGVSYYMRLISEKAKELQGDTPSPTKTDKSDTSGTSDKSTESNETNETNDSGESEQ